MDITVSQFKVKELAYLRGEIQKHERQVIENQAKVTENEELVRRVENLCDHCGEHIYPSYYNRESSDWEDKMQIHINAEHSNILAIE